MLARLSAGQVHVWRFSLLADTPTQACYSERLSAEELQRAPRFRFERDRRRFVVRRAILRQLLAGYLNCEARTIQFTTGLFGKPAIEGAVESGGVHFSCSHSEDVGLVAVARGRELGLDLEMHRPPDSSLEAVAGFFSPSEREELRRVPSEQWTQVFFDCWTCKEAFVKALGLGLSLPLDRFTVSLAPGATPRLISLDGDFRVAERWAMLSLDVGSECSAALVAEGGGIMVRSCVWSPDFTPST